MKMKITNRQSLSAAIIIFYLLPLLYFASYSIQLMSIHKSWTLLTLGLLLIASGAVSLILFLFYWEESIFDRQKNIPLLPCLEVLSQQDLNKQDKVTSIDLNLEFNEIHSFQTVKNVEIQDHSKEVNLLEIALKESQDQQEEFKKLVEIKDQELQLKEEENKALQNKVLQTTQDYSDYKLFSEEQLKQKQMQLTALQQFVEDQRAEMDKRQEQIHQLDTKVHDLSYEIKTLLYLNDDEEISTKPSSIKEDLTSHLSDRLVDESKSLMGAIGEKGLDSDNASSENPVRNGAEAVNLLKKCINIAQKLTGANYYSADSSRYREFSTSYLAIDQRRLFDSLRSETGALIVVYSQKESKVLFINNESKNLLGMNLEKFVSDFSLLIQDGTLEWKKGLLNPQMTHDSQARLLIKTKQGQEVLLNCHLGAIPTGLFRNYIIGVLYPA